MIPVAYTTVVNTRPVTLLQVLMRERHLTREQTVAVLEKRARLMGIKDFAFSVRQLDRWLARQVGDPRALSCRVAEAEFGYPIEQLLTPVDPPVHRAGASAILLAPLEEAEEIARRSQRLAVSNIDQGALERIEALLDEIGASYERTDAGCVYPVALRQRRWVDELLTGSQRLRQRIELYVLAGKLSALLGYLAFDRGEVTNARAYCDEAFDLAREAGHHDLAAWVRGIQSFVAYYTGRYGEARDLARDGQRWAGAGRQSIRLAVSGEARALGRLGDRAGVERAVEYAIAQRDRLPEGDPVGCFLSFEPLERARVFGNAASAYLALGAHDQVERFAKEASAVFSHNEARASHALTLMDLAVAHLSPGGDPDAAWEALQSAMAVGERLTSEVVSRRARHVLAVVSRRKDAPSIVAMADALRSWQPLSNHLSGSATR